MAKVADYFRALDQRMRSDFNRIRAQINDRDAKGHANERTVSEFIQKYVPQVRVRHNVEIIDSLGTPSGEMDVCASNQFQLPDDDALLLAEGVDFVVQVKGTLTGDELVRILDNAAKLKSLKRAFDPFVDRVYAPNRPLVDHLIRRIPYFVFAFQSSLRLDTALSQWQTLLAERKVPSTAQPEAIFVLDRGALLRFLPDGKPAILDESNNPDWFKAEFDNGNLLAFVDTLTRFGRGILHIQNPLAPYMAESGIKGTGTGRGFGKTKSGDEISPPIWDELHRSYQALAKAKCDRPDVAIEVLCRAERVAECANGNYPAELFEVRLVDGDVLMLNGELLEEINYHIRHMIGKDPALSPHPRANMPFNFESKVLGKGIEVMFRREFLSELQDWSEPKLYLFPPEPKLTERFEPRGQRGAAAEPPPNPPPGHTGGGRRGGG